MKHLLNILAIALLTVAPCRLSAQAAITLEVPVEVQNLHPDITTVYVWCFVAIDLPPVGQEISNSGQQYEGLYLANATAQVGRDGSLSTTLRVEFNQESVTQEWLHQAREYRCKLGLSGADETYGNLVEGDSKGAGVAQPGSLVAIVEGTLPNR